MKNIDTHGNRDEVLEEGPKGPLLLFENLIWLNAKEASEYLRLSVSSLRLKVHRGQIKGYKLGNLLRFKKSDLDQLLESSPTEGDSNGY